MSSTRATPSSSRCDHPARSRRPANNRTWTLIASKPKLGAVDRLTIEPATTDEELAALIEVRRRVDPNHVPSLESLRFGVEREPDLVWLVARLDGEPVGCGFVEARTRLALFDVMVV